MVTKTSLVARGASRYRDETGVSGELSRQNAAARRVSALNERRKRARARPRESAVALR